jgi:hypothetical protein
VQLGHSTAPNVEQLAVAHVGWKRGNDLTEAAWTVVAMAVWALRFDRFDTQQLCQQGKRPKPYQSGKCILTPTLEQK